MRYNTYGLCNNCQLAILLNRYLKNRDSGVAAGVQVHREWKAFSTTKSPALNLRVQKKLTALSWRPLMFYKPEIREKLQQRRKQLNSASMLHAAHSVAAQIVQQTSFLNSQHIACYLTDDHELDTLPLMQCATTLHKNLYIPILDSENLKYTESQLAFVPYKMSDPLVKNRYGINEPAHIANARSAEELDMIILPIIAFDPKGNRLGRGAGHYDRTLQFIKNLSAHAKKPHLIGLAYEFQKIAAIEPDSWDIPLDLIITEENTYHCHS